MKFYLVIWLLPLAAVAAGTNTLPALSPAYGEMPTTFWEQHGAAMLTGGLILLALAAIILWQLLKSKPQPVLPPEIVAREALAKLQRQPEGGKVLSEISQILRRYVIAALEMPTGELTTAEFCSALASSERIGAELAQTISSFLHECDDRKFSPAMATTPLNAANRALDLVSLAEKRLISVGRASSRAGVEPTGSSRAASHQDAATR